MWAKKTWPRTARSCSASSPGASAAARAESTAPPEAVLAIIKGSLANGLRYFSGYLENNDVVRVTGYLVKKSEIEKLRAKKQSLNNVTVFGMGAQDGGHALDRRVQSRGECGV